MDGEPLRTTNHAGGGLDGLIVRAFRCGVTRHNGTVQRDGTGVRSRASLSRHGERRSAYEEARTGGMIGD